MARGRGAAERHVGHRNRDAHERGDAHRSTTSRGRAAGRDDIVPAGAWRRGAVGPGWIDCRRPAFCFHAGTAHAGRLAFPRRSGIERASGRWAHVARASAPAAAAAWVAHSADPDHRGRVAGAAHLSDRARHHGTSRATQTGRAEVWRRRSRRARGRRRARRSRCARHQLQRGREPRRAVGARQPAAAGELFT